MERVRRLVHAKEVYRRGYTGRGIRIALLDSGVAEHTDLKGRIVGFVDFVNGRKNAYDDHGHGTHIAGIMCGDGTNSEGRFAGIAPRAELVVLKILDERGGGSTETALEALRWLEKNYERYHIRLLNFSVGFLPGGQFEDQKKLLRQIDRLWDLGIAVVAAAGNNGPRKKTVTVPGISRKVITVGSSDDLSPRSFQLKRGYSGRGPTGCCIVKPEILAPGTNIVSLSNRKDGYVTKSGTSMAAPVVSGALALALEKDSSLTPALLKLQLFESVVHEEEDSGQRCWGTLHVDRLVGRI